MYIQTWAELRCPKCSYSNFLCQGDMDDQSGYDPEGCCCWNCQTVFDFDGKIMQDDEAADNGIHFTRMN